MEREMAILKGLSRSLGGFVVLLGEDGRPREVRGRIRRSCEPLLLEVLEGVQEELKGARALVVEPEGVRVVR